MRSDETHRSLSGTLLFLLCGPLIWASHLTIAYGFQAVACARGWSDDLLAGLDPPQLVIAAATAAGLLALIAISVSVSRRQDGESELGRFLAGTTQLLLLLSLFGVAAAGLASAFVPSCPALR